MSVTEVSKMTLGFNKKFGGFEYNSSVTATANRNKILKLASGVTNPITHEVFDLKDIVKVASVCVKVVSSVMSTLASASSVMLMAM